MFFKYIYFIYYNLSIGILSIFSIFLSNILYLILFSFIYGPMDLLGLKRLFIYDYTFRVPPLPTMSSECINISIF